jgi:hypothetical protein
MLEEEVEEHIKVELLDLEEQEEMVEEELEEHVIQEQQEQLTLEEVEVEVDQFTEEFLVDTGGLGGSGIVIVKQYQAAPTYSIASGVWSLQCQYNYKKAGQWTPSATFM